jgi:hypothetical protein
VLYDLECAATVEVAACEIDSPERRPYSSSARIRETIIITTLKTIMIIRIRKCFAISNKPFG